MEAAIGDVGNDIRTKIKKYRDSYRHQQRELEREFEVLRLHEDPLTAVRQEIVDKRRFWRRYKLTSRGHDRRTFPQLREPSYYETTSDVWNAIAVDLTNSLYSLAQMLAWEQVWSIYQDAVYEAAIKDEEPTKIVMKRIRVAMREAWAVTEVFFKLVLPGKEQPFEDVWRESWLALSGWVVSNIKMQNALEEALRTAGYDNPEDRLLDLLPGAVTEAHADALREMDAKGTNGLWVLRHLRNRAVARIINQERSIPKAGPLVIETESTTEVDPLYALLDQQATEELLSLLSEAIPKRAGPKLREVARLRALGHKPFEVAEITGLRRGTVDVYMDRVRDHVREKIASGKTAS